MGGKKPLRRPLWPPTRATASNYYPLGLDGAGGAAKPLLRAPKKPAPLHGRLPAFSGAVDAFERARKCFLEWRYFFSIILSEFLKNRVALQLTSEYIQASSRVGRSFPGVAFALYDGSKSRDRSHYEQFKPYHESFYKHVEPTGATPFSKPARDRALHAVMIAMVRVLEDELSAEKGAAKFNRKDYAARIAELKKYITERASDISKRMNTEMVDDSSEIALEIDSVFEKWEQLAENFDEEHFYYGEKFLIKEPDDGEGRLMKPFNTSRNDPAFDTMTSMRNVDSTVAGNVLIWEEV